LGDIELSDIDQLQCHNPCEREKKMSFVVLWLANVTNYISPKCYPHSTYQN